MTNHVRNILKLYRQATQEDTINGVEWYARAERMAKAIASDAGLPLPTVIGVMAALSPNNRWERNCRDAATMCKAWQNGDSMDSFKVSCYNTMKAKAWAILDLGLTDDEDILSHLNGQKIRSFYSNIRGLDEVTIDGHALNIARGKREGLTSDKTNMGKREYRELQAAYVRAAKRVKVKPHVLQAITWTTWKRVHNI
ncbi:gp9 [Roseobacter phage SIO1]|uniref:Gp9 n=1 Tax=Roseobacter phage SIO1 TaxID=2905867 RepID=Q9G0H6_9CAUD|nr:gp9 [Roseobacter phage SIO1]AAG02592.1 gp9 [Roseobacter phage SIO1]